MRRTEREIKERAEIDAVLARAPVVRVAMIDDGEPYVVPLNFGYDGTRLVCHSAPTGRKIEAMRRNPRVCFEAAVDEKVVTGSIGCKSSARYRCVIGYGNVRFIEDREEKTRALDTLMGKFAPGPFSYAEGELARTTVFAIEIESVSGKKAGY
jgi:uncharacterized protein